MLQVISYRGILFNDRVPQVKSNELWDSHTTGDTMPFDKSGSRKRMWALSTTLSDRLDVPIPEGTRAVLEPTPMTADPFVY